MDTKDLKLVAGQIIVNSEMSKPAKLQMLNFIQHEADEYQLMALMLDGEIAELDDQAREIVKSRWETSDFKKKLSEQGGIATKTALGLLFFGIPLWAPYRAIKAAFDNCSRKCKTFGIAPQREGCIIRCKIEKLNKEEAALKKAAAAAIAKGKDKAKVNDKLAKKIAANAKKRQTWMNRLKAYEAAVAKAKAKYGEK